MWRVIGSTAGHSLFAIHYSVIAFPAASFQGNMNPKLKKRASPVNPCSAGSPESFRHLTWWFIQRSPRMDGTASGFCLLRH